MKLILTCEHGECFIPENFQNYFENAQDVLNTHRGYDLGALDLFTALQPLAYFSKSSKVSRLLIELNRSLHHAKLFSEFSKNLTKLEKDNVIEHYYSLYRHDVESQIKKLISANDTVLHISVHSFTPILNSTERRCDIGLLFDSRIKKEKVYCTLLKKEISRLYPDFNVRYNYPYLGKADGFTTYLRKQFPKNYIGVEFELNQKFANNNKVPFNIKQVLYNAIESTIYS
ncbi:N-formylglutamate amidohydrolase [Algibacter amylolyticus]|uniref:N-formylglutamate amidohydrolase n=1 Tax=Algibacter amylolyticus TaxID=1608400 RepID=A0A5M7AZK0_9FLAO|nr:N-formylglutamate amidohydrolase [Algibacter amylolyticus]KAA5821468.1 N-formylglutamate amidohydrolase [Algibacter amylolyticus]MBB5268345.1 putative N-formylglutamate amidohydrolase [Algibacter amylolyticus]TSJ72980.1 N-formylglutamate amidohydrolase [Algibacter amylolyticus]